MTRQNQPKMNEMPADEVRENALSVEIEETANELAGKSQAGSHIGEIKLHASDAQQVNRPDMQHLGATFTVPWGCFMKGVTTHDPREKVLSSSWNFNARMGCSSMQTGSAGSFSLYPTPIVPGGEVVIFFAPDREPKTVIAQASLQKEDGAVYDAFFEHQIFTSAPSFTSTGGTMKTALNILKQPNGNMFIQLGNTLTARAYDAGFAISYVTTVLTDDDRGQVAIMQFVQCDIRYIKDNGEILNIGTPPGQWYLDKRADTAALTYGRSAPVPVTPGTRSKVVMDDSPYLRLPNNVRRIEFNETFRTYLVYKNEAPDSRWAPLSFVEWGFRGEHEKDRATSPWPETFRIPPVLRQSREVPTHTLPEWVGDTAMLVERIVKEFPAAEGDTFYSEWTPPAQPAKQMIITILGIKTPQQVIDVENATGSLLTKLDFGYNVMLAWTSPENANKAKKVQGVIKVEELGPESRYLLKQLDKPYESTYIIYVAPFFLYNDSDINREFAMAVAPKSLEEVAAELVNICRGRGINNVVATVRSFSLLNLVFPALVTNEDHLRALAAHPQVNYVERLYDHKEINNPPSPVL